MRGRKPKSYRRHELAGFPGHRSHPTKPVEEPPDNALEDVPPVLADCPAAAAEWRRLVPVMRQQRTLAETDRAALIALCLEWSRYLAAATHLARDGATVRGSRGRVRLAPDLAIANKALAACTRLWPELGLTPASRARLGAPPPNLEDDAFAEFDTPLPLPERKRH
jgi:P27 family predicted phage terminase small subunit